MKQDTFVILGNNRWPRNGMNRVLPLSGFLAMAMGVAWLVPAIAGKTGAGPLEGHDMVIISVGPILILGGALAFWRGFRELRWAAVPAPIRSVIIANGLFLAFCALEFSDGLLLRGGRVFYWTSVLFLPALVLFYGQALARRWAWHAARIVSFIFTLWFVAFLFVIPFAKGIHGGEMRGHGGPGRIWAESVTLVFAGISAYVFWSLGRGEARKFYGISRPVLQPEA